MLEVDASFKICLFGEGGVGKTSLTKRFLTGIFELNTQMTMGAQIYVKYMEVKKMKVALQIWDFGGEEQFRFLLPSYSKGSSGGVYMFDITRYESMKKIYQWLDLFREGLKDQESEAPIPILMVGGKIDLEEKRSVSTRDATSMAEACDLMGYLECSALTGENVGVIFEDLTLEMLKRNKLL